jgi:hypothetical protein
MTLKVGVESADLEKFFGKQIHIKMYVSEQKLAEVMPIC